MDQLDNLSDEQLIALAKQKNIQLPKQTQPDPLDQMSDDELLSLAKQKGIEMPWIKSTLYGAVDDAAKYIENKAGIIGEAAAPLVRGILPTVQAIGTGLDYIGGAPTRAGLMELSKTGNPLSAAGSFLGQYTKAPSEAPTGKQLAQQWGLPETSLSQKFPSLYTETGEGAKFQKGGLLDPTASGAVGLGIDILADPTLVINPFAATKGILKTGSEITGKTAGLIGKGLKTGSEAIGLTKGAEELATGIGKVTPDLIKAGVTTVGSVGKNLYDLALKTSPKNPKFDELAKIGERYGIAPEEHSMAAKFGKNTGESRAERYLSEGPLHPEITERMNQTAQKIQTGIEKDLSDTLGGKIPDEMTAGETLRNAVKEAQDKMFQSVDLTTKSVGKYGPGFPINKEAMEKLQRAASGLEKRIKSAELRGVGLEDAKLIGLKDYVNAIKNIKTYKQGAELWAKIGQDAFKTDQAFVNLKKDIPSQKELQKLYGETFDALMTTVRKDINPAFADEIIENNKTMSEFFKNRDKIADVLESGKIAPEDAYKAIIKRGDSQELKALGKILNPDTLRDLGGNYLNGLIKRNAEGSILLGPSIKNINQTDNLRRLKALLPEQDVKNVLDGLKLGEAQGLTVLSTSGTGPSIQYGAPSKTQIIMDTLPASKVSRAEKAFKETPELSIHNKQGLLRKPEDYTKGLLIRKGMQSISPSLREDEKKFQSQK